MASAPPAVHPPLAHHFENVEQQRQSTSLGMWIFLVTEIMFFGGLFTAYAAYRSLYREAFAAASHHLDIGLGAFNTAVLITSSFTMAMAVRSSQIGRRRSQVLFLILTMLLGLTFLGVKGIEYGKKFEEHLFPGPGFRFETHGAVEHGAAAGAGMTAGSDAAGGARTAGAAGTAGGTGTASAAGTADASGAWERVNATVDAGATSGGDPENLVRHARIFYTVYFAMTGLHALHMVIGVGVLGWLLIPAARGRFSAEYHDPMECSGLYWHFVDIVWIFLFPLLYLIGRH